MNPLLLKECIGFVPILPNRVALVYLVDLDMLDFDFILGMDGYMFVLLPAIVEQG